MFIYQIMYKNNLLHYLIQFLTKNDKNFFLLKNAILLFMILMQIKLTIYFFKDFLNFHLISFPFLFLIILILEVVIVNHNLHVIHALNVLIYYQF